MTKMVRFTTSIPEDLYNQIKEVKKTDEYAMKSISETVRDLLKKSIDDLSVAKRR